jgi:hypothetical protein
MHTGAFYLLEERRQPYLGFIAKSPHLQSSMASSSSSNPAYADNRLLPLIACPFCGARVMSDISKAGTRPGTRYYKCVFYSVSRICPSRADFFPIHARASERIEILAHFLFVGCHLAGWSMFFFQVEGGICGAVAGGSRSWRSSRW